MTKLSGSSRNDRGNCARSSLRDGNGFPTETGGAVSTNDPLPLLDVVSGRDDRSSLVGTSSSAISFMPIVASSFTLTTYGTDGKMQGGVVEISAFDGKVKVFNGVALGTSTIHFNGGFQLEGGDIGGIGGAGADLGRNWRLKFEGPAAFSAGR